MKKFGTMLIMCVLLMAVMPSDSLTKENGLSEEAKKVYKETENAYDDFKKQRTVSGPHVRRNQDGFTVLVNLVSVMSKDSKTYALVFATVSSDWTFFRTAYDRHGKEQTIIRGESSVSGGNCIETYVVLLDKEYFDKAQDGGIAIRVYGRGGKQTTITLSECYVKGYFKKLKEIDR